jgi:membrane protease YdiL (CAAX protease family)
MSVLIRVLRFPLTRLLIWLAIFVPFYIVNDKQIIKWPYSYWLLAICVALAAMFVGRVVEGRPVREVGFGARHLVRDLLGGFALAGLMMGAIIGVMALAGWYRITAFPGNWRWVGLMFVSSLGTGLLEETATRGVLFRIVEEGLGSWISLLISGLIFGLLHLTNPNASLTAALAISVEAGLMLAAAYMLTRSLWLAIGIHWGWNFFQGPVFGAPVSGGGGPAMVKASITGPALFTGGPFGPEAGLVALAVGTGVGLWLLIAAIRRGQVVAPFWRRRPAPPTPPAQSLASRG